MALSRGDHLGPYEIRGLVGALGHGGVQSSAALDIWVLPFAEDGGECPPHRSNAVSRILPGPAVVL